jgi:hypothetical protein
MVTRIVVCLKLVEQGHENGGITKIYAVIRKLLQVQISVEIPLNFVHKTRFVDGVFFCFYILLVPYLAASSFYLYFAVVNTLLCGHRSWVRLDHFVSRTEVSVVFKPTIEDYKAMVEWKHREENQILRKNHKVIPLLYHKFHVDYPRMESGTPL